MPTKVLPVPAFGNMASTYSPVEVAQWVSGAPEPDTSVPQIMFPEESVSNASEQLATVESANPCEDTVSPAKVEVAVVLRRVVATPE